MPMTFGTGKHTYRAVPGWGGGPDGWDFGIVSSMATDSEDRVYVIDREPNPAIVVLDRHGKLLNTWGQDFFKVPHSLWISSDDLVYITDCQLHTASVHTLSGELISVLGTPGKEGAPGAPFNSPTWIVRADNGQNYVHRFSTSGKLPKTWGSTDKELEEFDIPHCVRIDRDGRVLVVDRTNERVQIFDAERQFPISMASVHGSP